MRHLTTTTLLVALLCAPFTANAWWVKVHNPMTKPIYVTLYYGLPIIGPSKYASIEPGSTHTFELGADCPRGLIGRTTEKEGYQLLMGTDMHGTWYYRDVAKFAAVSCANFNIKICDMPEGNWWPYRYSFCKE